MNLVVSNITVVNKKKLQLNLVKIINNKLTIKILKKKHLQRKIKRKRRKIIRKLETKIKKKVIKMKTRNSA